MGSHRADDSAPEDAPEPSASTTDEPGTPPTDEQVGERKRRPTARRIASITMLTVGAFVILGSLWTGWRAYQAYTHLADARATVATMTTDIQQAGLSGLGELAPSAATLADETSAARSAVTDPIYRLATHIPVLGDNLDALLRVSTSMDGIASAAHTALPALEPMSRHASWASNGHFDLGTLQPAAAAITDINTAVQHAIATMSTGNRGLLVGPVNAALNDYGAQLATLSQTTQPAARAATIVMPMLGADGPRNYLVVFQNLAETRATGGIFGFYALLHAENGTLTLTDAGSSDRGLGPFTKPVVDLDPALDEIYGVGMSTLPQNVNLRPDFPMSATTFAAMYRQDTGRSVDGVIGIDPVVISALLRGAAPIDLGHGLTLTSQNAVKVLLSSIYDVFPSGADLAERDDFTSQSLGSAFTAVLGNVGKLDPSTLLPDVRHLIEQRRILVWSAVPADQDVIAGSAVSGQIPVDAVGAPTVGVFIDDGSGAKLDYYFHLTASLADPRCVAGRPTATLTLTLQNAAPATGLPNYVLGTTNIGKPPAIFSNVILFSPTGGNVDDVRIGSTRPGARVSEDNGRTLTVVSIGILQGKTATITATVTLPAADSDPRGSDSTGTSDAAGVKPGFITTPMANPIVTKSVAMRSCGAD